MTSMTSSDQVMRCKRRAAAPGLMQPGSDSRLLLHQISTWSLSSAWCLAWILAYSVSSTNPGERASMFQLVISTQNPTSYWMRLKDPPMVPKPRLGRFRNCSPEMLKYAEGFCVVELWSAPPLTETHVVLLSRRRAPRRGMC